MKPTKPERVVLRTWSPTSPASNRVASRERVMVAVRRSPPPPTKAWGCSAPSTSIRRQRVSASSTVADRTWAHPATKWPASAAPKSSIASAGRPWASE